jgi:DHA2 family multidrug resistance protein-like MFS transporter
MVGFIMGSVVVPVIVRRTRPVYVMSAGLVLAAVGFGLLTRVDAASGLALLVTGSVVYSLGLSPVIILATDLIVGTAPVERAGAASAISETSAELGGALGIAILGSIGTAVYRGAMADAAPDGVPPEAMEVARATLGGAVAVAGRLPDPFGAALLDTARAAFAHSFALTAAICTAVAVATAFVVVTMLRELRAASEAEGQPAMIESAGE